MNNLEKKKVFLPLEIPEGALERILKLMSINLLGMGTVGIILDKYREESIKPLNWGMIAGGLGFTLGYIWYMKRKPVE